MDPRVIRRKLLHLNASKDHKCNIAFVKYIPKLPTVLRKY